MRSLAALLAVLGTTLSAQAPAADARAQRVNERIRALQQESDRLAVQARTLLGDLRKLEVERDLGVERLQQAQAAATGAQAAVDVTATRLVALEETRIAQLPDIKTQLVDVYKRGRTGYARLLFGARSMRDLGRATRAVAALIDINQQRLDEHQKTLAAVRAERAALEEKVRELQTAEREARRARDTAERAVASRTALVAQLDARRDLNAQFAGELQVAYERLRTTAASPAGGDTPVIPIGPFRGALDWPAAGPITGRFGQPVVRAGAAVARNGIEVGAGDGQPVLAVHPGTVSFSGPFSGFGNLVILDHGGNDYSLYGYLSSATVREGEAVDAGAELGRVGAAPAGPPALYFEIRIDGRSVDPLQWLKPR